MEFLKFKSCKSDSEVWRRRATKSDGTPYLEFILLYIDDVLCISEVAENVLRGEIGKYFVLKQESIGLPKTYLGNKLSEVKLENGVSAWALSSFQYTQTAVHNVKEKLSKSGDKLPKKATSPFPPNTRPELDTSPTLNRSDSSYYQSLIGVLRWIVELGRIDIACDVSIMASFMAMPRSGHLQLLYNIFAFLRNKHNAELVLDTSIPEFEEGTFNREDWTNTPYGAGQETLTDDIPEASGLGFITLAFVDADHAGDHVTRRSRTGFIIYCNNSPIYWLSKKQTSIETSSFGRKFSALRYYCKYLRGLRYEIRMMGIPCDFPSFIYGDNKSVLSNSSIPESMLKKKSYSISYHFVREGVAKDEWRLSYIPSEDNRSDILSKPISGGAMRSKLTSMMLHHIE